MSAMDFVTLFGCASMLRKWSGLGPTMDDVWANGTHMEILWIAKRQGVLTDRELRLCSVQGSPAATATWLRANTRPDWERARKKGAR